MGTDGGKTVFPCPGFSKGVTYRELLIAMAPSEPQPWFAPKMKTNRPVIRPLPKNSRPYFIQFNDVMSAGDAKDNEERAYLEARKAYDKRISEFNSEYNKQTYIQWPAAWADAVLESLVDNQENEPGGENGA